LMARLQGCSLSDDPESGMSRGYYLPIRIKMPAASARIPITITGIVMCNNKVIPARIR
jgi:hypothetical protein